jgi:hypothetical protein
MDTEKITEAQALAQDAQVAPAPVAADLLAEARELVAEGRSSTDPEAAESAPQVDLEIPPEMAGEALETSPETSLPDHALLPTGGILEMGHILDLLCAPASTADAALEAAPETGRSTTPTPDNPVYGAVYGRRY